MTRRVMVGALLAVSALAGCGGGDAAAGGDEGTGTEALVGRDFDQPAYMSEAASSVLGKCTTSTERDVTSATYEDCELSQFPGVSVRLSVYPSENQAAKGADYYSSLGPSYSEGHWAVKTSGDQKHLDVVLDALAAAPK